METDYKIVAIVVIILIISYLLIICFIKSAPYLRKIYDEKTRIKEIISGTSNISKKEIEIHLLKYFYLVEDDYNHILKSVFLFKEFRELVYNNCTDLELGKCLIKCLEFYEINGTTSNAPKIKNLGKTKNLIFLNQSNFLYYLLKVLIIQSVKTKDYYDEKTWGIHSDSMSWSEYVPYEEKTPTEDSESISYFADDSTSKILSFKEKILGMFPMLKFTACDNNVNLFNKNFDRNDFMKTIIFRKKNINDKYRLKYYEIVNGQKTYLVFFVLKRESNISKTLNKKHFWKLCNIFFDGCYYELKSFHAYWWDDGKIERISCYKERGLWFSFDNNEIIRDDAIICLLCDGNCDINLFYEESKTL